MGINNKIEFNAAIFPIVMTLALGKSIKKNSDDGEIALESINKSMPDIVIDLPQGAYMLYLQKIATENNREELKLLEKYAYGIVFSDEDYSNLLAIIMSPIDRKWTQTIQQGDILSPFGVSVESDSSDNQKFVLIEDAIPSIRVETWESIIIDILSKSAFDIIECFDFDSVFARKMSNSSNTEKLYFSLGAWKFTSDCAEQSLSNALRSAFMFTLVGYHFGDRKDQYNNFQDFFEAEFYKRVSLIYGIWAARGTNDEIQYIPLYDSFYNLDGIGKSYLISIMKALLDNDNIALDEKQLLKNRLIDGAGSFHTNISSTDISLEHNLIKPAINFVLLREKAKETLESAKILYSEGKYMDCANRCYYSMMFSLKTLLENQGKLSAWKTNELKESETHNSLENGLEDMVSIGVLNSTDKADFEYVKDQRWKCDYSLYRFEKSDAENCVKKARDFFTKIENITT